MKKILMLGLFAMLTATSFAQSTYQQVKKDVSTIIDSTISGASNIASTTVTAVKEGAQFVDTSTVTNKLYSDVKGIITTVAKGLGVAAERVYHVLSMHYMIQGIVTLLLIICGIWFLSWGVKKIFVACGDGPTEGLPWVLVILATLAVGGFLFATLPTTIGMIFNSEYYTINHIIELIQK